MGELLEAVVIGSGFGGAASCCRLAQKWKDKVMLLERGRRYPMGSFPRSPHQMADNFWNVPKEGVKRPKNISDRPLRGMFDIRNYTKMDVVLSAGLGGGSLIYANVFLEPPPQVFERGWPKGVDKTLLEPYYQVAKRVLGARPIPGSQGEPRRHVKRIELYQEFAKQQGTQSNLADICVFFGNDFDKPTEIGVQQANRYGATQTSCTYCAECDVGCNTHSKNTLDLNYLHVAEQVHGAHVNSDCLVEKIVPLNDKGEEDNTADGAHGYRVYYRKLDEEESLNWVDARRVVVSAGTLGTNELLLRCRDLYGSLPRLSRQLGRRFSGNADFLSFAVAGDKPVDSNHGPVITQYVDCGLFQHHDPERGFILQDASFPAFASWLLEGVSPSLNLVGLLKKIGRLLAYVLRRVRQTLCGGKWTGAVGDLFHEVLAGDLSYRTAVMLCMGLDKADGVFTLKRGNLDLDWPQTTSLKVYESIVDWGKRFATFIGGLFIPLPTWYRLYRNNITVHALGGCALADSPETGVVSAAERVTGHLEGANFGQTRMFEEGSFTLEHLPDNARRIVLRARFRARKRKLYFACRATAA